MRRTFAHRFQRKLYAPENYTRDSTGIVSFRVYQESYLKKKTFQKGCDWDSQSDCAETFTQGDLKQSQHSSKFE